MIGAVPVKRMTMTEASMPAAEPVEYIEARNDLTRKVRKIRSKSPADDPVKRAEAALKQLSVHFDDWMSDSVALIVEARRAWTAAGHVDPDALGTFFRAVHDLKGQATTLGFPLATRIATSLCALLERIPSDDAAGIPVPVEMIDRHVEALNAIVRENAHGSDDPVGSELTSALVGLADAYIARHGGDPDEEV